MNFINWQQFGLKKDPYDTFPLIEGGDLPIEQAFIGRENEKQFLNSLFQSENRLCATVCGDVGVGKTSLANFHKFIWKYHTEKRLFSFRREIEACTELLNKKNFIIEIIGSVLREIRLLNPELLKKDLLTKLSQIVDISQTMSISFGATALSFGANYGQDKGFVQPHQFSMVLIEEYFISLIDFIKNNEINGIKYEGLVVHVNNFDVVLSDKKEHKKVIQFFNEIRDMLQVSDVYYLFLGPNHFFKDIISSQQRVKSIFIQTPLKINPLSKTEIVQAFEKRMRLLKSDDVKDFIKPIEDEVIYRLYDLYRGDIRSIMSGVRDILGQSSEKLSKTLSLDEAKLLLGQERWEKIEKAIKLTPDQKRILLHLAQTDKYICQKDVAKLFKKAPSNISGYYFKPLKDAGIIEEKNRSGRMKYWGLVSDYIPLKWVIESKRIVQESIKRDSKQLTFFSTERSL
ncbi:MAG: winged helix-turn-helix domain-containing protein [Candidatus Margulisiibacteriota bacterium]